MNTNDVANKVGLYLKRSMPIILTGLASIGVVATTVLAVKATPKALELLKEERLDRADKDETFIYGSTPLPIKDVVKATWKCYIPAAVVGLSTVSCILGLSVLDRKQQTALTGAYILLENAYKEYKDKVKKLLGDDADANIRESIAKDKYDKREDATSEDVVLFYEEHYGKFFERTKEEVLRAEYLLNKKFVSCGYASLNDFYELLDLPTTEIGSILGWSVAAADAFYGYCWIDFEHQLVKMDDGLESYIIEMPDRPMADYLSY